MTSLLRDFLDLRGLTQRLLFVTLALVGLGVWILLSPHHLAGCLRAAADSLEMMP